MSIDTKLFDLIAQGELFISQLRQEGAEVDLTQLASWQDDVQVYAAKLNTTDTAAQAKGQSLLELAERMTVAYTDFAQALQQQHAQSNLQRNVAHKYMANS